MIFANIKISNAVIQDSAVKEAKCVVNRRLYTHLMITKKVATELGFKEVGNREVNMRDGTTEIFSYVGPVKLDFNGRIGFTGALINNEESEVCYLGSMAMDEMDLAILSEPIIELGFKTNPGIVY